MKLTKAALPFCIVLILAACGARLTNGERLAGIRALNRGGVAGGPGGGGTGFDTGATGGTTTGGTSGLASGGGTLTGSNGIPTLPPGENGGATDTGVTANQITLAVASDVTGVQAGLFKSTWQAMEALAAMVNSGGGIFGRGIKLLLLDTKADSVANQAAVQQACDQAFALVGSMSAFDDGGAQTGQNCGIPDLSAITVNPARADATNTYPAEPIGPHKLAVGTANFIKNRYGTDVVQHAAILWLDAAVTRVNAAQRIKAYESVGFNYIYKRQVEVLEPNYGPFVQQMKDAGVKYVNMVANYQSIQKLLQAMDQAGWYPQVRDWDSVAYSQNFLTVGAPANGSLVFLNTAIYEEVSNNPEMQLYVQWLNRVAPGALPDYFGFYAWSAGRLFLKVHQLVGPKITRKAFFAAIKTVHSWSDYGMHVAHDIGNKTISNCFMYLEIRNQHFYRLAPSSGFECNMGGLVSTG